MRLVFLWLHLTNGSDLFCLWVDVRHCKTSGAIGAEEHSKELPMLAGRQLSLTGLGLTVGIMAVERTNLSYDVSLSYRGADVSTVP